ncbi:HSP20-like chaperone [Anaeromyces robustus]|uniref:HSP20-like chaperone n=1 Tax=Anaeromyces robustus TaxID=1754192 RepID=A0A1Y1WP07_9FUNG|nr:HSP20-like chaperone [Anaeromyces robustus]|eukprot:ORX75250.1 HSP20-like chaperone [Anaeromyces robustus]
MTLYLYEQRRPFENTLFDVLNDDDFFSFHHPLRHQHGHRHALNRRRNPYRSLERQLCNVINDCKDEENSLFKLVDYTPNINLSEDEKNYYIHADLPGMTKDQVKMELNEDRILTISGERESIYDNNEEKEQNEEKQEKGKEEEKDEGNTEESEKMETEEENTTTSTTEENKKNNENRKYSMIECSYGKFSRSFTLPEDANLDGIQAKMENGVLEVVINKIETLKLQNRYVFGLNNILISSWPSSFKLADITLNINLSEDEIIIIFFHADLSGMTKVQIKMDFNEESIYFSLFHYELIYYILKLYLHNYY